MPLPGPSATVPEAVRRYADLLDKQFPGSGLGDKYITYMENHPEADPTTVYDTVVIRAEAFISFGKTLPGDIQTILNTGSGIINAIPKAIPSLNPANDITSFLGNLFTRENMVRFAEGALGVILVSVAVVRLTEGSKFANSSAVQILKKVPFA